MSYEYYIPGSDDEEAWKANNTDITPMEIELYNDEEIEHYE